jgi:hypothetical protein
MSAGLAVAIDVNLGLIDARLTFCGGRAAQEIEALGAGFEPSLDRHKVKRPLIFHHIDRRPLEARQARAFRNASIDGAKCSLWVISCRDALRLACPLWPRKRPRRSSAGAAAKGHKRASG